MSVGEPKPWRTCGRIPLEELCRAATASRVMEGMQELAPVNRSSPLFWKGVR